MITVANPLRRLFVGGIVVYLTLFGFVSINRTGHFEPDSMNYVNVARNISAGKGLTQPTLGFNQRTFCLDAKIPTPFTVQAPLYPILIASLSLTGVASTTSALLFPAIAYAAAFLLVYKLATELYDEKVALCALGLLSLYQPLHRLANYALSDVIAIAFSLLSFWLLVKQSQTVKNWLVFCSGIAAGLAFTTRYAFLPVVGTNVLFLLINWTNWRTTVVRICFCTLGFAVPAGLVFGHNYLASGSIMPILEPGSSSFIHGLAKARVLFERYLGTPWPRLQAGLFVFSLIVFSSLLVRRRQFLSTGRYLFSSRRSVPILWSAFCLAFLAIVTSRSQQQLERRFFVPIGVTMVMLWAAVSVRAMGISMRWTRLFVLSLLMFAIGREAIAATRSSRLDFERKIQRSDRLTWLASHTSDQDLIVGDDTVDIPFFLNRPFTLSFSRFLYTQPATYEKVVGYAKRHCDEYQNVYLVLHNRRWNEDQWRTWYGRFFADLSFGHLENYSNVVPLQRLRDGSVFQIICH